MKFRIRSPLLFLLLVITVLCAFDAFAAPAAVPLHGPCYVPETAFAIATPDFAPNIVLTAAAVLEARQLASEPYNFDALTRETYVRPAEPVRLFRAKAKVQPFGDVARLYRYARHVRRERVSTRAVIDVGLV